MDQRPGEAAGRRDQMGSDFARQTLNNNDCPPPPWLVGLRSQITSRKSCRHETRLSLRRKPLARSYCCRSVWLLLLLISSAALLPSSGQFEARDFKFNCFTTTNRSRPAHYRALPFRSEPPVEAVLVIAIVIGEPNSTEVAPIKLK